jgi:HEAT repeat protein
VEKRIELKFSHYLMLRDEKGFVRDRLAYAVGNLAAHVSPAIQQQTIETLLLQLRDKDQHECGGAAVALGHLAAASPEIQPHALQVLLPMLQDEHEIVRRSCVDAISSLAVAARPEIQQQAWQAILPVLSDKDWYVCRWAADTISKLAVVAPKEIQQQAWQALVSLLEDPDSLSWKSAFARARGFVCGGAANAIGRLAAYAGPEIQLQTWQRLLPLLQVEDRFVRASTAQAIGNLAAFASPEIWNRALQSLLPLAEPHRYPIVQSSAKDAISKLAEAASPEIQPQALKILRSELLGGYKGGYFYSGKLWVANAIGCLATRADPQVQQKALWLVLQNRNRIDSGCLMRTVNEMEQSVLLFEDCLAHNVHIMLHKLWRFPVFREFDRWNDSWRWHFVRISELSDSRSVEN